MDSRLARLRVAPALTAALVAAIASAGCGSSSSSTGTASGASSTTTSDTTTTDSVPPTPGRDSFHGRVIDGSGRYAGARGSFAIELSVAPGGAVRGMKALVPGRLCRGGRCRRLRLDISGTFTAQRPARPDLGPVFRLRGTGRTAIVGSFVATGTGRGTGYIRGARETLLLTVRAGHGTFAIDARSGPVPAFTMP